MLYFSFVINLSDKKNRAIIFLLAMVVLAGGIFYWMMFLNKGKIVIDTEEGNYPLLADVTPGFGFGCEQKEGCFTETFPGEYMVEVDKPGFFTYKETVEVKRGKESIVNPEFIFKPRIEEVETVTNMEIPWEKKSENYADNQSQLGIEFFMSEKELDKELLPKEIDSVIFAPNGKSAVAMQGGKYFLWDKEDYSEAQFLNEKQDLRGFLNLFNNKILFWDQKKIFEFDISESRSKEVASIKRGSIVSMFPSKLGKQFCFVVKTENYEVFIYNFEKETQKKIADLEERPISILPSEEGGKALLLSKEGLFLASSEEEIIKTPFVFDPKKSIWEDEETIISSATLPESIEIGNAEEVLSAIQNMLDKNKETFFKYNAEKKIFTPIVKSEINDEPLNPVNLFWENEGKSIVFLSEGKAYRLIIEI